MPRLQWVTECQRKKVDNALEIGQICVFGLKVEIVTSIWSYMTFNSLVA